MTPIDVPPLEEWSEPVAADDRLTQKIASSKVATETEVQSLLSQQNDGNTRQARAELIAAGGIPDKPVSTSQQLSEAVARLGDIRLACKLHRDKAARTRQSEGRRFCEEVLKAPYNILAKRQAALSSELYEVTNEIFTLECKLRGQGIGFYPIVCNVDTTRVLGEPNDPSSHFATLLREYVKLGHLNKLPKGLK